MGNANVVIQRVSPSMASEVIQLFKKNYPEGYYNKYFQDTDSFLQLLGQNNFVGIVALDKLCVVGFSGIYVSPGSVMDTIYLANFVVDKAYRTKGIGTLIDQYKVRFCENYGKPVSVYSLLSENSIPSNKIKENYGYCIWGVRLFYGAWEPNQNSTGHLIVSGKLFNIVNEKIELPHLHEMTQVLLKSACPSTKFSFSKQVDSSLQVNVTYANEIVFGQNYCEVTFGNKGSSLREIIEKMLDRIDYPYIAIRVNVKNFSEDAERIFFEYKFYPTSFLPYVNNGNHVIEYQYLPDAKLSNISTFLANKNFLQKCIFNPMN